MRLAVGVRAGRCDSHALAFKNREVVATDWGRAFLTKLIGTSPRYAEVVGQQDAASFARELQAAGYATDPRYAEKLTRIINGPTLRGAFPG